MLPSFAHLQRVALSLSLSLSLASAQSISISLAPKAGDDASSPLPASFAGFGIEPSNLFSFTGGDKPNEFSIQLLQNLADYAGAPPHIRLGGNTQDYMIYDSNFETLGWKENPQSTAQGAIAADSMIIGPGYFKALDRFPKGTPVTYGLNLAYQGSDFEQRIVTAAQAAVDGMKNVKLYSFEIGNEPDLYLGNQMRSVSWGGEVYTQQFLDRADAVYNQVLKPAGMPSLFFEPPATASTIGTTFEIEMLVQNGLMEKRNGNEYISVWNQHDYFYFIGVTPHPITLDDLMDLDATNEQFAYWEKQVAIGLKTGIPYVLREMSSVGPIGMHQVSDTFGAALWTLNFFLYTARLGISSVQMHMTDNSNASAWQPVEMYGNAPFVRPQYYAHVAMAQIVGNGNGTTQIAESTPANIPSGYTGRIRVYKAYANGELRSVVLINSKQTTASSNNKGAFTFNLNLGSANANKDIFLSYLTAPGADSLKDTTFNGMTFSDTDGKMSMVDDAKKSLRTSSSGAVSIPVRDSEAVVANLDWLLGSNAVIPADETASGSRKKSSAGPTSSGSARTAAWTGAVTTTLALAGSITGGRGDEPEETGRPARESGQGTGTGAVRWKMLIGCLAAVTVGFFCMA